MKPKLLLVVPAYNEAAIIASTIEAIRSALESIPELEYLLAVMDNGSTDGTAEIVRKLTLPNVTAIVTPERGKGAAILCAARSGELADFFGFIDADLSADPAHIADLLAPLRDGRADIAAGSRLLNRKIVDRSYLRSLSSRAFNALRQLLVPSPVEDSQCGLKIMNQRARALLATCTEKSWFLDMEFLARAHQQDLKIVEIPVTWNEQHFAGRKSKLNLARDGIRAIVAMVRIRHRLS